MARVLVITNSISKEIGASATILELSERLYLSKSVEIQLALIKVSKIEFLLNVGNANTGYKTIIPSNRLLQVPENWLGELSRLKQIVSFKSWIKKTLIGGLNRINFPANRKFLLAVRNADLILIQHPINGFAINKLRQRTKAKLIYNHAGAPESYAKAIQNRDLLNPAEISDKVSENYQKYFSKYDGLLLQSREHLNQAAAWLQNEKTKLKYVYPSCEEQAVLKVIDQSESPFEPGTIPVVLIGNIISRKGQVEAIRAMEQVLRKDMKVVLHLAGKIIDKDYYQALVQEIQCLPFAERIKIWGFRRDYLRFIHHARIVIQTSKAEGISRILREAMLLKKAIVSFDIAGTREILEKDVDAILVPYGKIEEFGLRVTQLISNKELCANLGNKASEKYQVNHSQAIYQRKLVEAINYFIAPNSA